MMFRHDHPACLPVIALAGAMGSLMGVDWTSADFGSQPIAIGAGPRALGMGGAFSAVADDATACTWNPAGLTQLERFEVAASLGYYHANTRPEDGERGTKQFLHVDHVSAVLPFFALGCQQSVGLAWQRQYDYTRSLSIAGGSMMTDEVGTLIIDNKNKRAEQTGTLATLGLCYAIEPRPGLSFGLTINQWADRWTRNSHYRQESYSTSDQFISSPIDPADPSLGTIDDTLGSTYALTHETRVTGGTSLVLGGWWQATPSLTMALVFKPGFRLNLETTSHSHEISTWNGMVVLDEFRDTSANLQLHHPSSLTVGAAWRQSDAHTVTCDLTATRWNQYYIENGSGRYNPVHFAIDPSGNRDLWSLRLGYEHVAILPRVVLVPRVGALLEMLPAATAAPSVFAWDQVEPTTDRWYGITAGLSLCQRQLIWDIGAQVRHGEHVGAGQFANPASTVDMTITTVRFGVTYQF